MSGKKIAICQDIKFLYKFLNHQTWLFIIIFVDLFGKMVPPLLEDYWVIAKKTFCQGDLDLQIPNSKQFIFQPKFMFLQNSFFSLWLYKNAAKMRYQRPWDLSSCLSLSEYLSKVGKDYLQAFKKDTFLYNLKTVIDVKVQASDYVTWK